MDSLFPMQYNLLETSFVVFKTAKLIVKRSINGFSSLTALIIPIKPVNISALVRKISLSGNSKGFGLPLPGNSIVKAIAVELLAQIQDEAHCIHLSEDRSVPIQSGLAGFLDLRHNRSYSQRRNMNV
uniref:Uncharacterized protein n=1 Tax=Glossina palpalis gambiensis TaxID=67801 RepID=A0A1B0BEJ9_9MUSC